VERQVANGDRTAVPADVPEPPEKHPKRQHESHESQVCAFGIRIAQACITFSPQDVPDVPSTKKRQKVKDVGSIPPVVRRTDNRVTRTGTEPESSEEECKVVDPDSVETLKSL
jgi:hypothetical protein